MAQRGRPKKEKDEVESMENENNHENDFPRALSSLQEICDELRMGLKQFRNLEKKYPISKTGVPGKLNGRWHIPVDNLWSWYRYVQKQEIRHPDSRRMRPQEPPEIQDICGR